MYFLNLGLNDQVNSTDSHLSRVKFKFLLKIENLCMSFISHLAILSPDLLIHHTDPAWFPWVMRTGQKHAVIQFIT